VASGQLEEHPLNAVHIYVPNEIARFVDVLAILQPSSQPRSFREDPLDEQSRDIVCVRRPADHRLDEAGNILLVQREIVIALATSLYHGQIEGEGLVEKDF
jgi:hypothetical protein